jgi:peptidoglycan/xylan/chitin deacetylase (PgdA/CDA1 family)
MAISLLYHDLVERGDDDASGFAGPGAAHYKLTPDEFADHLAALARAVRLPPLADPAAAALADGPTDWLLTFDDGGRSALAAADLLERHGWRGCFFVTTDRVGAPAFLDAEGVRELRRRGHVVGSHSCSHPSRISACSREQLRDEWGRSRAALHEILGEAPTAASAPGGFYSRAVAEAAAEAGYTVLFTSEPKTRGFSVAGCRVLGRHTVYRGTSAAAAAALAVSAWPRRWQWLTWNVKKVARAVGGGLYQGLRRSLLARSYRPGEPAASGGDRR